MMAKLEPQFGIYGDFFAEVMDPNDGDILDRFVKCVVFFTLKPGKESLH